MIDSAGVRHPRAEALAGLGFEVTAGVALVADDQLPAVQPDLKQAERDIAFLLIGGRHDRGPWGAVRRGEQMQSHPPKPAAGWPERGRLALSTERPHSTGVESISTRSSK